MSVALSLLAAAILLQVATFSTTIYLHRAATHRALVLHPALVWAFRFALWLTTGMKTKEWVAVHRKHHAFTEHATAHPAEHADSEGEGERPRRRRRRRRGRRRPPPPVGPA